MIACSPGNGSGCRSFCAARCGHRALQGAFGFAGDWRTSRLGPHHRRGGRPRPPARDGGHSFADSGRIRVLSDPCVGRVAQRPPVGFCFRQTAGAIDPPYGSSGILRLLRNVEMDLVGPARRDVGIAPYKVDRIRLTILLYARRIAGRGKPLPYGACFGAEVNCPSSTAQARSPFPRSSKREPGRPGSLFDYFLNGLFGSGSVGSQPKRTLVGIFCAVGFGTGRVLLL